MPYVTLTEKLEKLEKLGKKKIILPKDVLYKLSKSISLVFSLDLEKLPEENRSDEYILANTQSFFCELSRDAQGQLKKTFFLTLKGIKKQRIYLDNLDLFNPHRVELKWRKHFNEMKAGDILVAALPEIYLAKDIHDVFLAGITNIQWEHVLEEGECVTLLEKQRLDDLLIVKVFHKNQIYWAFGTLLRMAAFVDGSETSDHHFI